MKIRIEKKNPLYHVFCNNTECRKLSEYIESEDVLFKGSIKNGTTIARYTLSNGDYFFCTDCIDLVFQDMRRVMDKSLWVFH